MAKPRLRELDLPLNWLLAPGAHNAITDVPGVRVGHAQVSGYGQDPAAQSGVTVVIPGEEYFARPLPAAVWALNGAGEVTGSHLIAEWGLLSTPIFLTGTMSVGSVYDAAVAWLMEEVTALGAGETWTIPVVAECFDGSLHDARRYRPGLDEVRAAASSAAGGPVAEGCVGSGTGMTCFGFKGGIGTASRSLPGTPWHVGALVMTNFGRRQELLVSGVRAGAALLDIPLPSWQVAPGQQGGPAPGRPSPPAPARQNDPPPGRDGSIITVLATDAPLGPGGLLRLCKRGGLGIGRTGGTAQHGSGDIIIAFSTANRLAGDAAGTRATEELFGSGLSDCFTAAVEATEEAILNSLCAAVDTVGREGRKVCALPAERLVQVVRQAYGAGI